MGLSEHIRRLLSTTSLPIVPIRGAVLFPHALLPLTIAKPSSVRAIHSTAAKNLVGVVTERGEPVAEPGLQDLYPIGTAARILRTTPSEEDDRLVVFVQGVHRVRLEREVRTEPFLEAGVTPLPDEPIEPVDAELRGLIRNARELFEEVVRDSPNVPDDLVALPGSMEDPGRVADVVAWLLPDTTTEVRQQLLETLDVRERLRLLVEELVKERQQQDVRDEIRSEVESSLGKRQREVFLREELQAIQKELGETSAYGEDQGGEVAELKERLEASDLPEEARAQADRELKRLSRILPASPEHTVATTYLEWLIGLPWKQSTASEIDIARAASILDEEHYDLENVKERILEYLAVAQLKSSLKGPILCLVGPPGVGKTSLGRAIARATGRRFARVSLGGMHDEAEIRGHRRTYVGSLPGQIIQGIRRAGSNDPVFILDEVDKLGRDFRGDPASALLEVLDPEQNSTYRDHYLEVAFDLSRVLFITTANLLDPIPPTLLDRMEVLELPGYIESDKIAIARRFLAPRQAESHGVALGSQIRFTDEGLAEIVHGYTRESGIRQLEQKIAAILRKRARLLLEEDSGSGIGAEELVVVTPEVARHFLGPRRPDIEQVLVSRTRKPGVAVALAWTRQGGETLFVEASRMARDTGEFTITGNVQQVMQESARAARSWVRANASRYGVDPNTFKDYDLHLHVPLGAAPKDGPSAGVVMATALVSLFTERPVRPRLGMSGEMTLSGAVLPVGGVKQKVVAARRAGLDEVVLPADNRPDVEAEVPLHLRDDLAIRYVETVEEAVDAALVSRPALPYQRRSSTG